MLNNGVWPFVICSFFLHGLLFILINRAVTMPQLQIDHPFETYIITDSTGAAPDRPQSMRRELLGKRGRSGLERDQPLSRQPDDEPIATEVNERQGESSLKSGITPLSPMRGVSGAVENGKVMTASPTDLAASRLPSGSGGGKSATGLPFGAETVVDMSLGDAGAPRFIHRETPEYPFIARKLGKEGNVVLRLTLDEKGMQRDLEVVVKGGFGFTESAVQAVKKSIFSPAQKGGRPVVSRVLIPIRFELQED